MENNIEELVTEILMYLSSTVDNTNYSELVNRILNLNPSERPVSLLNECVELRQNTVSFKIRETQKRIESITKHINQTRFTPYGVTHEHMCLETLYIQSKHQHDRLCLLYKLDYLLLSVTTANPTKRLK